MTIDSTVGATPRTRVHRLPDKAVTDRAVLDAVLDAGRVAHLAVVEDGQPFVVPVAYARRGDEVLFHGSTASRLFRLLAEGQPTCLTVTILDGLVLARSLFESSMSYRSAMVLGHARRLEGDDELDGLRVISEHLLPGRWSHARQPSAKERRATMVLGISLDEASVKVSAGGPDDLPEDLADPALSRLWAGVVPVTEVLGTPIADDHCPPDTPVPDYVTAWTRHAT